MKDNKKGTKTPPKAPKTEEKTEVKVLDVSKMKEQMGLTPSEGLNPNSQVTLLNMMHETFRQDAHAAERYGISKEVVNEINRLNAYGQVAVFAHEIITGKSRFALTMQKTHLDTIIQIGNEMGLTFATKLLPAPANGAEGEVEVEFNGVKADDATKAAIEAEAKAIESAKTYDPTKISSEEELKEALTHFLTSISNNYEKFATVIPFYKSYLKHTAGSDAEQMKAINEMTDAEALHKITELVGKCPFTLNGMGNYMLTLTRTYKSPVPAYCAFRSASRNRKTGAFALSDIECAAYVKELIEWSARTRIEELEARKETARKDIALLSSEKKKNAKAIEDLETKIKGYDETIESHRSDLDEYLYSPTAEFADNIIDLKKSKDKNALRAWGIILTCFFDHDYKQVNQSDIDNNVQQWAGIVTNHFRNPSEQLSNYSIANLVDPRPISAEETKAEETKAEEKPAEESTEKPKKESKGKK